MPTSSPPKLFLRFFRWFCRPDLAKYIEGDLIELYEEKLQLKGKKRADLRFIADVLVLFRPSMIRPIEGTYNLNYFGMFKNYFKVSLRNLVKYKAFSAINIFGLSVAMSIFLLLILMLADQKSYDQFHQDKERVYRVITRQSVIPIPNGTTPFPLANTIASDYPIAEMATHLRMGVGGDAVYEEESVEIRGFFADSNFFEVFSFDLEKGDKEFALNSPNSMIISKEIAERLFKNENPIGKTVSFTHRGLFLYKVDFISLNAPAVPWGDYKVTGVIDTDAYKSHLKFDALVSEASLTLLTQEERISDLSDNWDNYFFTFTYVRLKPQIEEAQLKEVLADIEERQYAEVDESDRVSFLTQNLMDITPGMMISNPASLRLPIEAYYFLFILAIVIILSACLNYTNLSIARALTRAREIGVRKVVGAKKGDLIFQFLSESVLTTLLALGGAIIILVFLKAAFMELWINRLFQFDLQENMSVYVMFIGFTIVLGIIAGLYPAFYLSRYQPIAALKSEASQKSVKLGMRKVLNSSQFVVSLFFIITSILIFRQFNHFMNFDYGFASEDIINVELQSNDYNLFVEEFSKVPGVKQISAAEYMPATGISSSEALRKVNTEDERVSVMDLHIDEHFIENLEIDLLAGRTLIKRDGETEHFVLFNETAVEKMGYESPEDVIGEQFEYIKSDEKKVIEVVGVVKDFRTQTPMIKHDIDPLMLGYRESSFTFLNIKVESTNMSATVGTLSDKWRELDAVHPFKYFFFDEQLSLLNQVIRDLVSILGFIAFLAITIACLGLLGMATYITERRTKEVGIRKVLGASESAIAMLLSRDFLKMLLISVLIAAPLSYFVNNLWLQNFPNRVEFGVGTVLLGCLILLALGLLTIASQTIRASRGNPVEALRTE